MNISWVAYLPSFLRSRLEGRTSLQKILGNTGWLFFDKVVRMGVGLIVGVWVARYLGPEQFGTWNYATAFTMLFSAIASLGLDNLVVRDLVNFPEHSDSILGTAFVLRVIAGIAALAIAYFVAGFMRQSDGLMKMLVFITAAGFIVQSFMVIDYFYQSNVQSKYVVISLSMAFAIATLFRIIFILKKYTLLWFAAASFFELVLGAVFLIVSFIINKKSILSWRFDSSIAVKLLSQSWPMIFAMVANTIYLRIDQVMLGEMLGEKAVGIYSAAVKVCESWYFIIGIVSTSLFPAIIQKRQESEEEYYALIARIISICILVALCFIAVFNLFSKVIIVSLFGKAYVDASVTLAILSWTGILVSFGSLWGQWIVIENLQKWGMYNLVLAAVINVLLNIVMIPLLGINGAAIATVISNIISIAIVGLFNRKLRFMNLLLIKGIINVLRKPLAGS